MFNAERSILAVGSFTEVRYFVVVMFLINLMCYNGDAMRRQHELSNFLVPLHLTTSFHLNVCLPILILIIQAPGMLKSSTASVYRKEFKGKR